MIDLKHIDNLEYFKNTNEMVPIGELLGDPELNLTKSEFKKILKEVLEQWGNALEMMED